MKIKECLLWHFGSFKELDFSFENNGLTLIFGNTGAGKSTFQDAIPWILYGTTSKNGLVDDVRPWNETALTTGNLKIICNDGSTINVFRIRGDKKSDLFWQEFEQETYIRGKNVADTQKMLEKRIGVTKELYFAASVFNEFSVTGNFFTANIEDRRKLFDKIANLELAVKITEGTKNERKKCNKSIEQRNRESSNLAGNQTQLEAARIDSISRRDMFERSRNEQIEKLKFQEEKFEQEKSKKIKDLETKIVEWESNIERKRNGYQKELNNYTLLLNKENKVCFTCGAPNAEYRHIEKEREQIIANLKSLMVANPFFETLAQIKANQNTYLSQLEELKTQINPFDEQIESIENNLKIVKNQQVINKQELEAELLRLADVEAIYELSFHFKNELAKNAIAQVENKTNYYLTKYFDAEIKVTFTAAGADNIEVEVSKNGNICSYTQLSRGQRSILKLCFSVAVMKAAANRAGIHFHTLFFDEVLDGQDTNLKLKALGLFQELEIDHESIFITDHATELHSHFNKRFNVTLEGNNSIIKEV